MIYPQWQQDLGLGIGVAFASIGVIGALIPCRRAARPTPYRKAIDQATLMIVFLFLVFLVSYVTTFRRPDAASVLVPLILVFLVIGRLLTIITALLIEAGPKSNQAG